MDVSRIYRLLRIVTALQTDRYYNARELAEMLEVSVRTVYRDLKCLTLAHIPFHYDARRMGYKIPTTFFLPPISFSLEEAMAMLILAGELGGRHGIPFQHQAVAAALKLESALPAYLREHVADLAAKIHIRLDRAAMLEGKDDVYQRLVQAIARRQRLQLMYDSLYERRRIRTKLSPYRLLFSRHSWYVIGLSSMHRSVRTFNLRRIASAEPLPETYRIPSRFSLERLLGNAWHLIREDRQHTVRLRFAPKVATNVAEVRWHRTQRTRRLPDDSLEFTVDVEGLEEIYWWVLGYGDQVEVLEPEPLRRRVAETARRVADRYAVGPALPRGGVSTGRREA